MAGNDGEEAKIRDFLAAEMDNLPKFIKNLDAIKTAYKDADAAFAAISPDQGGPTPLDLLRRILARRNLRGIGSLYDLELIDTEFALLSTGKGGFQPSADILARCTEDTRLFLLEVKQLIETERQAVTELSAYAHGLNSRIWNMTLADYVWVPICVDWRTTVRAAFANEAIWSMRPVLPMKCSVRKDQAGAITAVDLELLSLLDEVAEPLALAQFAWACFDTLVFELKKEPSDPRTVLEFISATAARHGFSGCVLYGQSSAGDAFENPYVYALAVHNPYRAALKRRQLETVLAAPGKEGGTTAMRKDTKKPLWGWLDIDFRTMEDRMPTIHRQCAQNAAEQGEEKEAEELLAKANEPYLSVEEMALSSGNRLHEVFAEVKKRLDLFCKFEVSAPDFKGFLDQSVPVLLSRVSYFGLMQEAVFERLQWEVQHAAGGDGPVIGDYGGDPIYSIASPNFFLEFMELMNFDHDCQTDYEDNEDDETNDED